MSPTMSTCTTCHLISPLFHKIIICIKCHRKQAQRYLLPLCTSSPCPLSSKVDYPYSNDKTIRLCTSPHTPLFSLFTGVLLWVASSKASAENFHHDTWLWLTAQCSYFSHIYILTSVPSQNQVRSRAPPDIQKLNDHDINQNKNKLKMSTM